MPEECYMCSCFGYVTMHIYSDDPEDAARRYATEMRLDEDDKVHVAVALGNRSITGDWYEVKYNRIGVVKA
jgi:hypothetical protein